MQEIQDALSSAGLSVDSFMLREENGGVHVESKTNDCDQVAAARDALPATKYEVGFARSITEPSLYVQARSAEL